MIVLGIVLYVFIGIIVGVGSFVFLNDWFDDECISALAGIFWPVSLVLSLLIFIISSLVKIVYQVMNYLKTEGFHYYKEELPDCCGKCKYMIYCNNHSEVNKCTLSNKTKLHSLVNSCEAFKKDWLWRFKIRYKWDDNLKNK